MRSALLPSDGCTVASRYLAPPLHDPSKSNKLSCDYFLLGIEQILRLKPTLCVSPTLSISLLLG